MITDQLLPLPRATREFFAGRISTHSVRRWIVAGVGKYRVRLKATRIGNQYFIARSDAEEFLSALRDPSAFTRERITKRTEAAIDRLRKAGA